LVSIRYEDDDKDAFPMITIKLFAGLGNQLFQYSYGLHLRSEGQRVRFFATPGPGNLVDIFDLRDDSVVVMQGHVLPTLRKAWAKYVQGSYETGFYQEARFAESALAGRSLDFIRRREYERSPLFEEARASGSVAIHVRGGDTLSGQPGRSFGGICTAEYYAAALDLIRRSGATGPALVFTDDRVYAEGLLAGAGTGFRFSSDPRFAEDPGFDLFMMSRCANRIIANSTFSLWGAFLAGEGLGLTVCPSVWTNDGIVNIDAILPARWPRLGSAPAGIDSLTNN
jgi:hypothetical protein